MKCHCNLDALISLKAVILVSKTCEHVGATFNPLELTTLFFGHTQGWAASLKSAFVKSRLTLRRPASLWQSPTRPQTLREHLETFRGEKQQNRKALIDFQQACFSFFFLFFSNCARQTDAEQPGRISPRRNSRKSFPSCYFPLFYLRPSPTKWAEPQVHEGSNFTTGKSLFAKHVAVVHSKINEIYWAK